MKIVCCDLESVFTPEIWVGVAERTGIDEIKLTTRDIPDYNALMKKRIRILKEHKLTLKDIQEIIAQEQPLPGAKDFLDWLRSNFPVIIVSDTFTQFATPLMEKLGHPMLMCNTLKVNGEYIIAHQMRQENGKQQVVKAMKNLNYQVIAFGDSYNDVNMLQEAHTGILFCPPDNVRQQFPDIPVANSYIELRSMIEAAV